MLALAAGPACATCGAAIPPGTRRPRRYCSKGCQRRAYRPRQRVIALASYHRLRHQVGLPGLARAVFDQARRDRQQGDADAVVFLRDPERQGLWRAILRAATVLGCD